MSSNRALSSSVTLTALFIILFSVLIVLIYLPGCTDDDAIITQSEKTVTGKVSGREGVPLAGVMVSVNSGDAVMTSSYGTFSISGVEPPYDLNIFHQPHPFFYQYRGLNTLTPDVELDVSGPDLLDNRATIYVKFPQIPPGESMQFRYITGMHTSLRVESYTDSSANLLLRWEGQAYINGDLALLQVVKDPQQRIVSYQRFAAKMIWVQNAVHSNVVFTPPEMQFDPEERNMQITAPPNIVFGNMKIKLLFRGFPFSSAFEVADEVFPSAINFVVPGSLSYPVRVSYELEPIDTVSGFDLGAKGFMDPGESYNITMPSAFELLYPAADTSGVNYNTVFSHNHSGKVYEYTIGPYNIITTESSIRLPQTEKYGVSLPSNTMSIWFVKVHNAAGMDEFVKPRDMNYAVSHNIIIGTPLRIFTTGIVKQ